MQKFAIVDIETTGSWSASTGITEIAILVHDTERITGSFQTLINPGSPVLPFVTRLTGITNEMLSDAPTFPEVAKQIWEMTDGCVFVAHSVNFDYSYIHRAFKDLGADFRRKKLCTVRLSRKLFPGYSSYSLGNICSSLGIEFHDRHRAMGDAQATVKLFEKCLAHDKDNVIGSSLKRNSKEAMLPALLSKEVYDNLPEKTGVYYFHDAKGKIIYVGKAINIRSRIYSHFTGKSARLSFINSIADISWKICGSELIALLLESDEIKRLYPLYNQAQKRDRGNYVLSEYTDRKGIHHLAFAKNHPNLRPLQTFQSFEAAREFMFRIIDEFELCPKYCGMQTSHGACFDYQVKKCRGVCAGSESVKQYNKRVARALKSLQSSLESRVIIDEGRTWNEKSVVVIENGIYKGFGYYDANEKVDSVEAARPFITPFRHTADVQRILNGIIA
ncbi:MAG TPA: exonuclease domain-containing protein [Chitinophagaceae bacterium]|nr:exonuclease domain-containing protein [Chitinophagaceae bacterium]